MVNLKHLFKNKTKIKPTVLFSHKSFIFKVFRALVKWFCKGASIEILLPGSKVKFIVRA